MRRPAVLIALLTIVLTACGEEEPVEPAPPPAVQQRTKPVWCPKERFEQVKRPDGRYDVKRIPHGTLDARDLLGMGQAQAERLAKRNGCSLRVVERDGERMAVTDDLRVDRINVKVHRGYVTALQSVG
jgi:hypothetical protein